MKTYTFYERKDWPRANLCKDEPDKAVWTDEKTGMVCMIHRNSVGALCGYVAVEPGHPWFEKTYWDISADVHGGLTFANSCDPQATEERGICHVPEPGKPDHVWWLGFDCAHYGDMCPGMGRAYLEDQGIYRDFNYVKSEVEKLAKQVAEAAGTA